MKNFGDVLELHTRIANLYSDINGMVYDYIQREKIDIENYEEKLSKRHIEVGMTISEELNIASEDVTYLNDHMQGEGDSNIIAAFVWAYITEQLVNEVVRFEIQKEKINAELQLKNYSDNSK